MEYILIILMALPALFILKFLIRRLDKDAEAQRALDRYLKQPFDTFELGKQYERYIGYLYETEGYNVDYNGAIYEHNDMGRDLVVKSQKEVSIIQTKRWAKYKTIKEKEIFQLYGSMTHYRLSTKTDNRWTKAVFYTTAQYSEKAKEVAKVLNVELKTERFDQKYPMVKCKISENGDQTYYLPFDQNYDKIKINTHRGDFFAQTVQEAVTQGFRRAKNINKAA